MLHQALAARLTEKLMHAVVALDTDTLKEMLKEDPHIAEARERLRQRVERLRAIKERLLEFERGSNFDPAEAEEDLDSSDDDYVHATVGVAPQSRPSSASASISLLPPPVLSQSPQRIAVYRSP